MLYWLVSAPECDGSKERTWNLVQQKTTYEHDFSINYKFTLPELRVGTLDSLLVLSDDLVKVCTFSHAHCQRQYTCKRWRLIARA